MSGGTDFWESLRDAIAAESPRLLPREGRSLSAVAVPMFRDEGAVRFLLTKRSPHLPHHAGQISFPGGVPEGCDADLQATALRETEEEIGLGPDDVEVLGQIDDALTARNFLITPYVVRVRTPFELRVNDGEIARTLTPALSEFYRTGNPRLETYEVNGDVLEVPFYTCNDGVVWGATGRIVYEFLDRLRRAGLDPTAV